MVRLGMVRIAWLVLAILAAFVIFVECMAEVGGDATPIEKPRPTVTRQVSEPFPLYSISSNI